MNRRDLLKLLGSTAIAGASLTTAALSKDEGEKSVFGKIPDTAFRSPPDGNCFYAIEDGDLYEVGAGVCSGGRLSRNTVLQSSFAGQRIVASQNARTFLDFGDGNRYVI